MWRRRKVAKKQAITLSLPIERAHTLQAEAIAAETPRNEPTATLADFFSCPRLGLLFFPLSFASLLLCLLRVPPKNSLAANNVEAVSSTHCTRLPLAQSPVSSRARLNDANMAGRPRRLPTVLLQPANTPMQCRVF